MCNAWYTTDPDGRVAIAVAACDPGHRGPGQTSCSAGEKLVQKLENDYKKKGNGSIATSFVDGGSEAGRSSASRHSRRDNDNGGTEAGRSSASRHSHSNLGKSVTLMEQEVEPSDSVTFIGESRRSRHSTTGSALERVGGGNGSLSGRDGAQITANDRMSAVSGQSSTTPKYLDAPITGIRPASLTTGTQTPSTSGRPLSTSSRPLSTTGTQIPSTSGRPLSTTGSYLDVPTTGIRPASSSTSSKNPPTFSRLSETSKSQHISASTPKRTSTYGGGSVASGYSPGSYKSRSSYHSSTNRD